MRKDKKIIEPGQKYNKLEIISFSHSDLRKRKWFNTICECGTLKIIMGSAMISGNTKSCGCYSSEFKKERNLLPDNLGVKRQIILQYKRHAKGRGIYFDISEEDFIYLLDKNCNYCDSVPSNIKTTKNFKSGFLYSGVDRIDSSKEYSKSNCVPCCSVCNYAKSNMSIKKFQEWAIRLGKKAMAEQWAGNISNQ